MKNLTDLWTKSTLLSLGLGQLLSLLITSIGFTSSLLANKGINAPYAQGFLNYLLLTLVYGSIMIYRGEPVKGKFYYHIMLTFVDVAAKYFVVKAYQQSSLTSVMLLDCWTIPCVLFLTWLVFKTKYRFQNVVGVGICVAGLIIVVLSDVHYAADRSNGSNQALRGDLSIIFGATLYGVINVCEVFFVGEADGVELMALLGYYGALLSASLVSEYESNELKSILSSPEATFSVVGFSLAMFLFYSGVTLLLKINGSTMLNLSMLTSNMWAVLIQIFVYHEKVDWIYFIAFAAVVIGLIVYSWGDEMEPNNGETSSTDEKTGSNKTRISNDDGSRILFQGARNSLCYISRIIKIQR